MYCTSLAWISVSLSASYCTRRCIRLAVRSCFSFTLMRMRRMLCPMRAVSHSMASEEAFRMTVSRKT